MNIELLRKIQAHNTAHPEQLDMTDWIDRNGCGTTACIAGHACLLSGLNPPEDDVAAEAVILLGLNVSQAMLLFHSIDWPSEFKVPVMATRRGTPMYAAAVNRFIDHFIETGGAA